VRKFSTKQSYPQKVINNVDKNVNKIGIFNKKRGKTTFLKALWKGRGKAVENYFLKGL
jgi:hypothetical protein